jgi:S1/P1 Nuclease
VYALVVKVRESLRDPKYSRAALEDSLVKNASFASWIDESHELAKTVVYSNGDKMLAAVNVPYRSTVPADAPDVGPGYEQQAQEVARRRAALAGYRLADKLKVILSRQSGK